MSVEEGFGRDPNDDDLDDDDLDDENLDDSEDDSNEEFDDDDDAGEDVDNVGDLSVELNVEELVAKLEATDSDDLARRREIKRRIEELREQREAMKDLDSTYNFNFDDEP
ncbi:MAG: hypothetical protein R3288_10525 [Woeseiaceae bacterium]|nr:hypothetical protein [Woeseiaceae bacterium]